MHKLTALAGALLGLCAGPAQILASGDFPAGFLIGKYHLIGRAPDVERTYYGRLTIRQGKQGLAVARVIAGETVQGSGDIVKALCCEGVELLRMRFVEEGREYEETCMVDSDLDNYARVTCLLYRRDESTDTPGFEALFIDLSED